jgi:predicted DNA-binding WGR domain protein
MSIASAVLAMTRDLFGGWCLWREWGRRGSPGTLRSETFEQEEAVAGHSVFSPRWVG